MRAFIIVAAAFITLATSSPALALFGLGWTKDDANRALRLEACTQRLHPGLLADATGDLLGTTEGGANNGGTVFVPEIRPGILAGYLSPEALPNSLALLPPPPAADSAALALDEAVSRNSFALRDTPRWTLAASDADLAFPHAAGTFSCALRAPITQQDTPHLYMLMRRSLTDFGLSTYAAKDHYKRVRPFVVNGQPICTPGVETHLMMDGSYPSGHSAVGWGWALILSEIAPDRTDAILARGRAFGESRVVCNVHWKSDVIEGRFMGAGTLARLRADPAFRADLKAAKAELVALRAAGLQTTQDCDPEAAALALDSPRAP